MRLAPKVKTGFQGSRKIVHIHAAADAGDLSSVPSKLDFDVAAPVTGLRVGYFPRWMQERPATEVDRAAMTFHVAGEEARRIGGDVIPLFGRRPPAKRFSNPFLA
mgnify:CR=1 FL=1